MNNQPYQRRVALCMGLAALFVLFAQMSASAALSAVLTNRWNFSGGNVFTPLTTVTDSIAGQIGQLEGDAFLDGTQVEMDGTAGTCMVMTNSLLTNLTAVTFEAWIVDNNLQSDNVGLFGFGNSGTAANSYIRFVPTEGADNSFFELFTPAGTAGVQTPSPGLEGQTVHLSLVYDPVHSIMAIYTNGLLDVSTTTTISLTNLSFTNAAGSFLGRGPWDQDATFNGNILEFRVWNGALSPLDIIASDISGPGTVPTSPAVATNLTISATFQETVGAFYQATVFAQVSGFASPVNITAGVTNYTSGNTNVLTISSTGLITTHNQGSTTIVANFGSLAATNTITVVPAIAILTNRWSFSEPNGSFSVTDSVSGAVGACISSGTNYCYVTNGTVVMGGGTSANPGWVSLPGGLVTGLQTVTFEAWIATNSPTPDNVGLFEFSTGAGTGGSYLRYVYHDNGNIRGTYEITSGSTVTVRVNNQPPVGGRTNAQHLAIIYDPNAQVMAVFTNGVLATVRNGTLPALSNVPTNESGLGQSPWHNSGDPYFAGAIDDFRIYSGTLTPQKIAMSYLAGANASSTSLDTNDPGPLQSVALTAPASMTAGSRAPYGVLATYHNLANFDIVHNSYVTPVPGLTVTSGNSNVISLPANGVLQANSTGSALITTVYQGVTNTATVTVIYPPVYSLLHRYSFTSDASDSIGGANGSLIGTALINNAMVNLDVFTNDYVSLPGGLVSSLQAVTLEAWFTTPTLTSNSCLFNFWGGTNGAGYFRFTPRNGANHTFEIATGSFGGGTTTMNVAGTMQAGTYHVTCVYDPSGPVMSIYSNGVLEASVTNTIWPLSTVPGNAAYLGYSPFTNDAGFNGSIDEFRIYSGRLTPVDIATTQLLGPNVLITPTPSLGASINGSNATLTWPIAASGFSLVSSPVLGPSAVWTPVTNAPVTVGGNYQVALPHGGASQYFRLRR